MSDVPVVPMVRCDACGRVEEKRAEPPGTISRKTAWKRPYGWGGAGAGPGGGEEGIHYQDLCPECLCRAVVSLEALNAENP